MEQAKGGRKGLGCSLKHKQPWIQQPHGPSYRIQKMMHVLQSQSTGEALASGVSCPKYGISPSTHTRAPTVAFGDMEVTVSHTQKWPGKDAADRNTS